MKELIIIFLSLLLAISVYFNYQTYSISSEKVSFSQKQICANYQPEMTKQIQDYHGTDINYELREVFYSLKADSCLYYYTFLLGNGNSIFVLKDYLTNTVLTESNPISNYTNGFAEYEKLESDFESKINEYR